MSITTYAELQTSIQTWLDRSDLSSLVPDFITLFEAAANRRLRVRQMLTSATLTPSSGSATLPTDYLAWRRLTWSGDPSRQLEYVEPDYLYAAYPTTPSGTPAAFTIEGSTLKIRPTSTTNLDFLYYQKVPVLSVSNTTNWLLTAHPDAYLAGSLAEAFAHTQNAAAAGAWLARRDVAFDEIEKLSRKTQGQSQIRTVNPTP